MSNNQGFPWDHFYQPYSPPVVAGSSGSSNFTGSPSWANGSLGSSPSPSEGYAALPPPPVAQLAIDYNELLQKHLPVLYHAFQHNPDARQNVDAIVSTVAHGYLPHEDHLNGLMLRHGREYRCPVGSCERHATGYDRLDRAREHFRSDHLGAYFPCNIPGCPIRCKRAQDLKAHLRRHEEDAPRYVCEHCPNGSAFTNRSNLNRHIEQVHGLVAPRRVRGT